MNKEKAFPTDYCLENETVFEDFHPRYNKESNTLLLLISDIEKLLSKCQSESDSIGVRFGGEISDEWDRLEIHGVDGNRYTLEYQIGIAGGSFYKRNVSKAEVILAIERLPNWSHFYDSELEFFHW